tara:strand:- start:3093 stop:6212 length:3120 start_codon:yes stop_codon:yes gene_type:complete
MPSLYESTANTGEVSSSNFTTLYNASGLAVPNAGAGSITGNLNVGGNLTVQGNSLLIGDVTLQSTLSLPNYTFPLPDGSTDQVLVTDGNGNLYWTDVSAIPGADYNISATTATGGANLTLANTAGFTDSVKFANGTNINVVRTDANTITISTIADDIPNGTARGQVFYWDGSAWIASSNIRSAAAGDRLVVTYENSTAGVNSALILRKDYGATNYTTGDGVAINFGVESNSQSINSYGLLSFEYSATDPQFLVNSSITGFATPSTPLLVLDKTTANIWAPNITLNTEQTGVPSLNAVIQAERGSSTNATLTWNETTDTWDFNNSLTVAGIYSQTGESMTINSDSSAADSYLYMKGATEYLKWDNTNSRFELSDQLFITQSDIPAILERRNVSTDISPSEQKSSIRLINRVTDAANNDVVTTGPGITFARTSGVSDATERLFASMGSSWNGTDKTASLSFTWSNDNFAEPTPGVFPGSYTLLDLNSNNAQFENDSLYVDYSAAGGQQTATSITGGNTLVFGTVHGFAIGERIKYMSTTQNGLIQFTYYYVLAAGFTSTQCRLSLTTTGTAVVLTNGTGLTLNFAELTNQVGINTNNPGYTLDVNGTLNSVGNVTVQSDEITINDDKTNTNVNLNFGRATPDNNALIRWNATSDSFEWSSGNGVFYDFINADLTAPFYNGQLLSYRNGEWVNDNRVDTTDANERNVFNYRPLSPPAGFNTSLYVRKDYSNAAIGTPGVGTYANGAGTAISFQVVSDTQAPPGGAVGAANQFATIAGIYSSTNPSFEFRTSINNGTASPPIATFSSTIIDFAGGTLTLNSENTGAATDATIVANRGSSGTDAIFAWVEASSSWISNYNLIADQTLGTNAGLITFNNDDGVAADAFLTVKRGVSADVSIKWDEATDRWQDTTDGTNYLNLPNQNLDTTDDVNFNSVAVDGVSTYNSQTTTTTALTTTAISTTTRTTQKVVITITDNVTTEMHVLEALAFMKGTSAYLTTYGEMYTSAALATFTADVSAGSVRILATPASTNSTTFKVARISVD